MRNNRIVALFVLCLCFAFPVFCGEKSGQIDWDKAQQLYKKRQSGVVLSADEQQYLQRAIEARQKGEGPRPQGQPQGPGANAGPDKIKGVAPLNEMEGRYKGEDGGLYGKGRNEPAEIQKKLARKAAGNIRLLDAEGNPSVNGKIAVLTIGMSNTSQESEAFIRLEKNDSEKSDSVVLVNGAQGGITADKWIPGSPLEAKVWSNVEGRLKAAGVSFNQVQAVWLKEAIAQPAGRGEFPAHAKFLLDSLSALARYAKVKCPNLQIIFISSRIYGGYASTNLNPEPYAFESAFPVRWLIREQSGESPELNADPALGTVKAPVFSGGPIFGRTEKSRGKATGLPGKKKTSALTGLIRARQERRRSQNCWRSFSKAVNLPKIGT